MARRVRVHVVDSDSLSLRLTADTLSAVGFAVITGHPTRAVIDAIWTRPDVVVVDVRPDERGIVMPRHLKAVLGQHVPVVAFSAMAMRGDREDLLASGYDVYLRKPTGILEVAALVRRLSLRREARPVWVCAAGRLALRARMACRLSWLTRSSPRGPKSRRASAK